MDAFANDSDEDRYDVVHEVDYDHPSLAPLNPHDRLRLARGPDWDTPPPMRQRRVRRPASAEEVRRMQFETARRIIFGSKNVHGYSAVTGGPMPGKEQREAWTTAGFVRPDEISYQTPFQLGSVTLMITRGLNKEVPATQAERMAKATPAPIQVVWMEMPGPIVGMTLSGRPRVSTSNDPDYLDGLMVNYQWVCIGFLRADDFIPMMPNFASLFYVEIAVQGHPEDKRWNRPPVAEWPFPQSTRSEFGQLTGREIKAYLPIIQQMADKGVPLETPRFVWMYPTALVWKQLVSDPSPDAPIGVHVADIARFVRYDRVPWHEQETPDDLGTYSIHRRYKGEVTLKYKSVMPIHEARRMFNVSAPEVFCNQLGFVEQQPFAFLRADYDRSADTELHPVLTAWRADDVAAVIYAQSYLMHVLTGPDRRRYEGVPEGVATRTIPDAKETQEPLPCFKVVRFQDPHRMDQVMLLGPNPVPFVSNGTSLRFFNPSLALRAARQVQEGYGDVVLATFARAGESGPRVFAYMLSREDKALVARLRAAMQIPLDRFEQYEFMGTPIVASSEVAATPDKEMAEMDPLSTCSLAGCNEPSKGFCAHCRVAGYCKLEHAVKDYGRHEHECASCIQTSAGAVMWGVEVEVGQSQGSKEQAWEPVDLVHGRVDQRGLIASFVSNRDLLDKIGREIEGGTFHSRDVFPGSRVNMVQAGKRRTDNPYTIVYLSVATGGKQTIQLQINPTLSDRDVASLTGKGTTVHVTQKDITAKYGTNLPALNEEGMIVAGIQIGAEKWQIWGTYNLVEQKDDSVVVRTYQAARAGTSRLARRALGHEEVVRIRGFDRNKIGASISFRRMGRDVHGEHVYQIQDITIHVPDTGGQSDPTRPFLNAAEVGPYTSDSTGDTSYPEYDTATGGLKKVYDVTVKPVYDATTGALKQVVETTRDGLKGSLDLLTGLDADDMELNKSRIEAGIHTSVTIARTNPENRVHVAALINVVAAKQAELKETFQQEELIAAPSDVKRIQQELTEVARLRSVLESHMATLAAEASGEKELENISSDVHAALAQSQELVGISLSDRYSRASETRKIRKRAKNMSREDATAAFLQAVADAEGAQANNQVGTQFINRANIYYERLLQVSGHTQDSVKAAALALQRLKATEHTRYKGKQSYKKQQNRRQQQRDDKFEMQAEDDLANGK